MGENSDPNSVQPGKNGGKLRRGNKGNKGGTGRPPNEIRRILREVGYGGIAAAIERGLKSRDAATRLRALDLAFKYGLGPLQGVPEDVVTDRLRETIKAIHDALPEEQATLIVAKLRKIWA